MRKYLIIGAGGTGGSVAANLAESGQDVTVIARGDHLKAIQEKGLTIMSVDRGTYEVPSVKASDEASYKEQPDVIVVGVKDYSLNEILPFMARIVKPETVIIPLSNVFGTGARIQEAIPHGLATDGVVYISANIMEPGVVRKNTTLFKLIFGARDTEKSTPLLHEIADDFQKAGINTTVSDDISRDAMQKFGFISPFAAAGSYFDASAGDLQPAGEKRDLLIALIGEVAAIADKLGIHFPKPLQELTLAGIDGYEYDVRTSFQRDWAKGGLSEVDGLIFEVPRMGKKLGVPTPAYDMVSKYLAESRDMGISII